MNAGFVLCCCRNLEYRVELFVLFRQKAPLHQRGQASEDQCGDDDEEAGAGLKDVSDFVVGLFALNFNFEVVSNLKNERESNSSSNQGCPGNECELSEGERAIIASASRAYLEEVVGEVDAHEPTNYNYEEFRHNEAPANWLGVKIKSGGDADEAKDRCLRDISEGLESNVGHFFALRREVVESVVAHDERHCEQSHDSGLVQELADKVGEKCEADEQGRLVDGRERVKAPLFCDVAAHEAKDSSNQY